MDCENPFVATFHLGSPQYDMVTLRLPYKLSRSTWIRVFSKQAWLMAIINSGTPRKVTIYSITDSKYAPTRSQNPVKIHYKLVTHSNPVSAD